MEELEKAIDELNIEKSRLEEELNSGNLNANELISKSDRIAYVMSVLDEKEMRWLELSDI